jgi:hypothetical protein
MVILFRVAGWVLLVISCFYAVPGMLAGLSMMRLWGDAKGGNAGVFGAFMLLAPGLAMVIASAVMIAMAEVLRTSRAMAATLARLEARLPTGAGD